MKSHMADKEFTCDECEFRTTRRKQLFLHIERFHSEDNIYVCAICHQSFKWRNSLNTHMKVHTGLEVASFYEGEVEATEEVEHTFEQVL